MLERKPRQRQTAKPERTGLTARLLWRASQTKGKRERQTDRQAGRQAGRQASKQAGRTK